MSESRSPMSDTLKPKGLYSPWNFPGQNTGVGRLFLLQGIFPTQGSNPDLAHCRWIIYPLSYKGSPRILKLKGTLTGVPWLGLSPLSLPKPRFNL